MIKLPLKLKAFCHAINIEALLVYCGSRIHLGPCGPSDALSLPLLLLLFVLHVPGLIIGGGAFVVVSVLMRLENPDSWWLDASVVGGNALFVALMMYRMLKRSGRDSDKVQ